MLAAAGHRSVAAGNVGTPILDVVTEPEPYPVVAVELSSFQLYWSVDDRAARRRRAQPGRAPPGLARRHGVVRGRQGQDLRAQARSPSATRRTSALGRDGGGRDGARAPADWWLPARARPVAASSAWPAAGSSTTRSALRVRLAREERGASGRAAQRGRRARGSGAGPRLRRPARLDRRRPRRASCPSRTASAWWPSWTASTFIDDSKASNPAAAAASLAAFPSIVWVAGGLFRGTDADLDAIVRGRGAAAARRRADRH